MAWNDTLEFMDSVTADRPRRSSRSSPKIPQPKKEIGLVRWRIGFSASNRGGLFPDVALQVEGIRIDDGENWTSSEVLSVDLPRTIKTANTTYTLVGKIDSRVSLEKGMPQEFISKFTNGFPSDWKETIDEFINFLFQHAGRQRGAETSNQQNQPNQQNRPKEEPVKREAKVPTTRSQARRIEESEDEQSETDETEHYNRMQSPARMASLSPLNSPSIPDTPTTHQTRSPYKTPTPVKRRSTFKNVTVRRTSKRETTTSSYNAAPTPVLNRSKHGRVIKPRLAPGERIVYDCYGSPIEARKNVTRTHIYNNSSFELETVCKHLNLEKPQSPTQAERRLTQITDRTKARKSQRQSLAQRRSTLIKMLNYDKSQEIKELESLSFGNESAEFEASPIFNRLKTKNQRRRIESDEESEEDSEEEVVQKRRGRPRRVQSTKKTPKNKTPAKRKQAKSAKKTKSKPALVEEEEDSIETETSLIEPPTVEASRIKPRAKIWSAKNKENLKAAFNTYNPCTDRDWMDVLEVLPVEWTLEEIKAQAQKMKLKPLLIADKPKTPTTDALTKIRALIPKDGKLPQRGTVRREALEEEVMQHLFVKNNGDNQNENQLGGGLDDSDDMFLHEAIQDHALDNNFKDPQITKFTTPSKRAYYPKAVSACRRRSSLNAINSVGDDFSLPERGKMKYRFKYRAQQFNRRNGINTIQEQENEEDEFFENSAEQSMQSNTNEDSTLNSTVERSIIYFN